MLNVKTFKSDLERLTRLSMLKVFGSARVLSKLRFLNIQSPMFLELNLLLMDKTGLTMESPMDTLILSF